MSNYKIRIFHKDIISEKGVNGKVDIRTGNEDLILDLIKENLSKSRKIIVEVL